MDVKRMVKDIEEATGEAGRILDMLLLPFNNKVCKKCSECCCDRCGGNQGYLHWQRRDEIAGKEMTQSYIAELKKRFTFGKRGGFLTKEGCRLPRHLRSRTCLECFCNKWYRGKYRCKKVKVSVGGSAIESPIHHAVRLLVGMILSEREEVMLKHRDK